MRRALVSLWPMFFAFRRNERIGLISPIPVPSRTPIFEQGGVMIRHIEIGAEPASLFPADFGQ